jgi:sulfite oxidase
LSDLEKANYRLKVDLTAYGKGVVSFSLDQLKAMKKTEIVSTLQCSGNRRSGFNTHERTSGTPWGQGAISTAKFGGVLLKDLLKAAGLEDPIHAQEEMGLEHVRFHALDGMQASIGIEKACNPYGDVMVAYEMNDEPIPRDHGYPLRMVVPGYAAVRNVKWLERIEVAETEAEGAWQRGLNYKTLPPGVTDANDVDLAKMPSMMEASVFSGITKVKRKTTSKPNLGDRIPIVVSGWAWAGGGRNIVRVDVSGDQGKSWASANLLKGSEQRFGRAWAWTFWECELDGTVDEDGNIQLMSKAVDMAFNTQPENARHGWNVRGLGNNSWYRKKVAI